MHIDSRLFWLFLLANEKRRKILCITLRKRNINISMEFIDYKYYFLVIYSYLSLLVNNMSYFNKFLMQRLFLLNRTTKKRLKLLNKTSKVFGQSFLKSLMTVCVIRS